MGSFGGLWINKQTNNDEQVIPRALQMMSAKMQATGKDRHQIVFGNSHQVNSCSLSTDKTNLNSDMERPISWGSFINEEWYTGHQEPSPIAIGLGITIVFEGQLYEIEPLVRSIDGCDIHSSNAEVLHKGFLQFGHDLWPRLHGQFAIAVINQREAKPIMHLVRDRAGVKPVFYALLDECFVFGSNIRTIIASGKYTPEVDWRGIWQILSFPAPPQPSTVFEKVKALPRGQVLTFRPEQELIVQPYWQIPVGQQRNMTLEQAGSLIHESLVEAVKRRVELNSASGSLISGGVDSPYLCALLSKHIPALKALTFAISGDRFSNMNEHELAGMTAKRYQMNHIISFYSLDDIWPHFEKVIEAYEQPGINLDPYYFTGLMAKENGVKYLFNGLSADELHGGFHYFKYIPLWHWVRLFPWLTYPIPRGNSKRYDDLKNLTIPKTIDEYYSHGFSVFQEFEKKALLPDLQGFNSFEDVRSYYMPEGYTFKDDVEGLLHMMYANVPNHHMYRFEQFTQMFGVQAVYPFVDNDAVDVAFQVPSRHKVRRGNRKVALKKAAAPYIYQGSIAMKKKGITMPYGYWINHELKDFVTEKLAALKTRSYFSGKAIDEVDKTYRKVSPAKVWKLVMIELWMEKFIDQKDVLW